MIRQTRILIGYLHLRTFTEVRDLVLNHTSLTPPDTRSAIEWISDLIEGVSGLIKSQIVSGKLIRTSLDSPVNLMHFQCADGSRVDNVFKLLRSNGMKEVSRRLQLLVNKSLIEDLDPDIVEKFESCDAEGCGSISLTPEEGAPLLLCALSNGIAVSFPSQELWKRDVVNVRYIEDVLLEDGNFAEYSEVVDNLSQSVHAHAILDRHRESTLDCSGPRDLWLRRRELFPHLTFGPDVEQQLNSIDNRVLSTVINQLTKLNDAVAEWRDTDSSSPKWRSKVSWESDSVMNESRWVHARTFRTNAGGTAVFEQHARYGSGRIHFIFDQSTGSLEIGYIGPKLPPHRR